MAKWLWVFAFLIGPACSSHDCDLVAQLKARAESGAADCGHAALGGTATQVDSCVVTAFENRQAFFAQYDRQGTDSKVIFGIAGDARGNVTFLLWDSDPSGGSGADSVISGIACIVPAVDSTANRDSYFTPPLSCTSSTSLGRTCG